mgnify:CR=1 FL=1
MAKSLREWNLPCLIHQPSYNMLNRWIEGELLQALEEEGIGCIAFTPLAQGLLTDKYLHGVPEDARIKRPGGDSLKETHLSEENLGEDQGAERYRSRAARRSRRWLWLGFCGIAA